MVDPRFEALIRAAENSFNPTNDDALMQRVVQVTLYVGGFEERLGIEPADIEPLFRYWRREVHALLVRELNVKFLYESEELDGSKIQTLFYGTREITLGGTLRSRLFDLSKSIAGFAERTERRVFWAAVIGDMVVLVVPGGQVYVAAHAAWIISALTVLHAMHEKADIAHAFREMMNAMRGQSH
jgi:hypothetical protein